MVAVKIKLIAKFRNWTFSLEVSSPVDPEKKPFARLKEEMSNLGGKSKNDKSRAKKEKPPKKLTKSKSTEQQPQNTPSFGTTVYFQRKVY
jgi:hypothetical protein